MFFMLNGRYICITGAKPVGQLNGIGMDHMKALDYFFTALGVFGACGLSLMLVALFVLTLLK